MNRLFRTLLLCCLGAVPLHAQSTSAVEQRSIAQASLLKRISELEGLVERLRSENAMLRQEIVKAKDTRAALPATADAAESSSIQAVAPAGQDSYWISSTGKRHNSNCRYYQTSKGSKGSADQGVACKLCGG